MIATVEVIRAIRVPAGSTLNGVVVAVDTWAMPGRHDIDADLLGATEWTANGYIVLEKMDGTPVVWSACCQCD